MSNQMFFLFSAINLAHIQDIILERDNLNLRDLKKCNKTIT